MNSRVKMSKLYTSRTQEQEATRRRPAYKSTDTSFANDTESLPGNSPLYVFPALKIGRADSPEERAADEMAHRVVGGETVGPNGVPRSAAGGLSVSPAIADRIQARSGQGEKLPEAERAFFEPRFGRGFGDVTIHRDGEAASLARSLNAKAFTVGSDIYFGSGQYSQNEDGRRLMAHELTHTVQQGAGVQREVEVQRAPTGGPRMQGPFATGRGSERRSPDEPQAEMAGRSLRSLIVQGQNELERLVFRYFSSQTDAKDRAATGRAILELSRSLRQVQDALQAAGTEVKFGDELQLMGGVVVAGLVGSPVPEEIITWPAIVGRLILLGLAAATVPTITSIFNGPQAVQLTQAIALARSIRFNADLQSLIPRVGNVDDAAKESPEIWRDGLPGELYPEVVAVLNAILAMLAFDTGTGPGGREPDPERGDRLTKLIQKAIELLKELRTRAWPNQRLLQQVRWLEEFFRSLKGGY